METIKRIIKNVLGKTQAECKAKLAAAMEATKGVDVSRADEYTVATWLRSWYDIYARPLHRRVHTPYLHPRYEAEAGRGRPNHGQLHGTGDVNAENDKNTGEEAKPPLRYSLGLSGHFPRVGHGVGQAVAPHFAPHFFQHFGNKKSTENRSFRCSLELLGGFEPPTSSLPRMRSTY